MAERSKNEQPGTKHESGDRISTAPPPFDPEEYARSSESILAAEPHLESQRVLLRPTAPPDPTYEELRDSCSEPMPAADPVGSTSDIHGLRSDTPPTSDVPSKAPLTELPADDSTPAVSATKGG
jgi:hypothetical protein